MPMRRPSAEKQIAARAGRAGKSRGIESAMNTQRVSLELLSDCVRLLSRFGRSLKSYILNDKAEQEWAQLASVEAEAELRAQESRGRREKAPALAERTSGPA
jgi:hypothetical protein